MEANTKTNQQFTLEVLRKISAITVLGREKGAIWVSINGYRVWIERSGHIAISDTCILYTDGDLGCSCHYCDIEYPTAVEPTEECNWFKTIIGPTLRKAWKARSR